MCCFSVLGSSMAGWRLCNIAGTFAQRVGWLLCRHRRRRRGLWHAKLALDAKLAMELAVAFTPASQLASALLPSSAPQMLSQVQLDITGKMRIAALRSGYLTPPPKELVRAPRKQERV